MGECPIGFEMEEALGRMKCQGCLHQCVLSYLCKEIKILADEIAKLKDGRHPF